MKQYEVYPECNVDTNLVGHILGGYPKHKSTCNEVTKAVNNADGFAIGIIDADKRQATMDPGFVEVNKLDLSSPNEYEHDHVTMYVHKDCKRYMFTVKPAMDMFILHAAQHQGVDMKSEGFAANLDGFKKQTKRIQAAEDPQLRKLFDKIKGYPELVRLRNTLRYLMQYQLDADVEVAKRFFNGELSKEDLIPMLTCFC